MRALAALLHRVAPTRASILLCGETGTGKERVAEAIHALSPRAGGPLVKVSCGGLAAAVLESELFGHERGAFTDAVTARVGRFEQADGGTLFLDEIAEISPAVQVKLLGFLQDHTIERVGGGRPRKLDVRVVAATHRDLGAEVRAGRFREDLWFRLDVVRLEVPPLRERRGDIPALARHFLVRAVDRDGREVLGFSESALDALGRHDWSGNVRELEHAVERAVVMARGPLVELGDLPEAVRAPRPTGHRPVIPGATFADIERHAILATLEATGGRKLPAARMLGISPRTLQGRLRAYACEAEPAPAESLVDEGSNRREEQPGDGVTHGHGELDVESVARLLHESGARVARDLGAQPLSWDESSEEVRTGRRNEARHLLEQIEVRWRSTPG